MKKMYIWSNLKQAVTVGVNQIAWFVLLDYDALIYFSDIYTNEKYKIPYHENQMSYWYEMALGKRIS